jgi:dihydrofolate reductase
MPATRTLRYQVAASLDGFIAGPNGEADWIPMDPEIDFGALTGRYDAVLMGRKSWEAAAKFGGGGALFGLKTYVASRTLAPITKKNVTLLPGDAVESVRALKREPGKELWLFGGGTLCASLLDAGLVDLVEIAQIPILLGRGIPLLAPLARRVPLKLVEERIYRTTGTALITYRVA